MTNSAPVLASALPSRSGQLGAAVSWALPGGSFTDANGDALSYSLGVEIPAHWITVWNAQEQAWEPDGR